MLALGLGLGLTPPVQGGGGVPAWLEAFRAPGGDLPNAALVFTDTNYFINGGEVAVDILLGGHFLSNAISASGMRVAADSGNHPAAIGPLLTLMNENHTVIMEWDDVVVLGSSGANFIEYLAATDFSAGWEFYLYDNDPDLTELNGDSNDIYPDNNSFVAEGRNKAALTVDASTFSMSLNGAAIATGPRSVFDVLTHILFGHNQTDNANIGSNGVGLIRSIIVYSVQADADLPALSAL